MTIFEQFPLGRELMVRHDGFVGCVIGYYLTHEGKPGVVLQQNGTRVVHVYAARWFADHEPEVERANLAAQLRRLFGQVKN